MKFTLEIDCSNAAFGSCQYDASVEIARILRDLASKLPNADFAHDISGDGVRLRDVNGNRVGVARFTESGQ